MVNVHTSPAENVLLADGVDVCAVPFGSDAVNVIVPAVSVVPALFFGVIVAFAAPIALVKNA